MNETKIRDAFQRLNTDVDTSVDPRARMTEIRHGPRRSRALALGLAAASIIAAFIFVSALSNTGDRSPVATTAPIVERPTTAVPTTTMPPEASRPPTTVDLTGSPTTIVPTALSTADLVVVNGSGVWAVGPLGAVERIDGSSGRLAVGIRSGDYAVDTGIAVTYLSGPGDPVHLTEAGESIRLVDVSEIDGDIWFITIQRYPGNEGFDREAVILMSPRTLERRTLVDRGAGEGGISRVSHADGLFVLTWQSEGESWLEFVDRFGEPVDVANPKPYETFGAPYVDQAVLSPDGSSLALLWSESNLSYDAATSTDLVVYDMATGEETGRITLPGGAQRFLRLDWDGEVFAISRDGIFGAGDEAHYGPLTALFVEGLGESVVDTGMAATASVVK